MSDTAITIEKLKDEEYVREIVEGLGGAKAIVEGIREHGRIVKRMWAERAALTEAHPNQWVAMGKDGVVSIGDSIDAVIEDAAAKGLRGSDLVIEFLDTDPPLLIL
jgi:hypothetical protein